MEEIIRRCCSRCFHYTGKDGLLGHCLIKTTTSNGPVEWRNNCDDFKVKSIPICEMDRVQSRFELLDL